MGYIAHGAAESDKTEYTLIKTKTKNLFVYVRDWPKSSFGFSCKILQKHLNEMFWLIWCHIILPFHMLCWCSLGKNTGMEEWFAILSSNGPGIVTILHYDLSNLALYGMAHSFIELLKPP